MAHVTLASMFWHRVEKRRRPPGPAVEAGRGRGSTRTLARGRGDRARAGHRPARARPPQGRGGRHPVGEPRRVGAGRLRHLLRGLPHHSRSTRRYPPDLIQYIVNDAGVKTLFVEDPAPARQGPRGAGEDGRARADRGHAGLSGRAVGAGHDLGGAAAPRPRQARSPPDRAGGPGGRGRARTTSPPSCTPRAPPGRPRAWSRPTATTWPRSRPRPRCSGIQDGDIHLLFLPLAHSFARLESFIGVHRGLTTAFAESIDKLRENLPEVKPHFICSVPRVFEKVYAGVLAKAEAGSPVKRKIFNWAVGVGREVSRLQQARRPVPAVLALKHRIAHALVFAQAARGPRRAAALRGLGRRPARPRRSPSSSTPRAS